MEWKKAITAIAEKITHKTARYVQLSQISFILFSRNNVLNTVDHDLQTSREKFYHDYESVANMHISR